MKLNDQEVDWKFWAAVPIVGIVLCAGLIGFHRCTQIGRSLSVDGLAMVGTTLVAAAIGFLAVVLQVRSGGRQLREQLADQHLASAAELERQKRAVAAALSAEIDDFYKFSLRHLWEKRERICGPIALLNMPPYELGPLPSTAFVVYRATAHQLGTLGVETVKSVVGLYNFMASFVDHYQIYRGAWSPSSSFHDDPELATKLQDVGDVVPTLILDSYRACEHLAKGQQLRFAESGFDLAHIGEADENGQTMKQALEGEAARIRQRISKS
jgi:hypothetical protein